MRSLETNWLSRFDKTLVRPEVIFSDDPKCSEGESVGGFYLPPGKYEWMIDGRFYDGCFGIIAVKSSAGDRFARSVIAHEWRHHWQIHNGISSDCPGWSLPASATPNDWDNAIRKYFRESRSEMDALLFERRVAPDDVNELMMDVVMGNNQCR